MAKLKSLDGKRADANVNSTQPGDPRGKLGILAALLRRKEGATLAQLIEATGWQAHSVRGAMAGALRKKHLLTTTSEKRGDTRVYRSHSEPTA